MRRYELSDFEWRVIQPHLPNKVRGVARVDDRKVLNGILWRFRTGSPWADVPDRYGPYSTPTTFMLILGYREVPIGAKSAASSSGGGMEMVKVLDVSGSMSGKGKIAAPAFRERRTDRRIQRDLARNLRRNCAILRPGQHLRLW